MVRHGNTQNKKGLHFPLLKAFCQKNTTTSKNEKEDFKTSDSSVQSSNFHLYVIH